MGSDGRNRKQVVQRSRSLSEPGVELVLDDGGKPCSVGSAVEMADAEVLLD